jgi:hypothetical protein
MSNVIEHNIIAGRRDRANYNSNKAKRFIWVTFQKVGFHLYPAAATDENLKDVAYLGKQHRHKFYFKVQIEIFHNDRELEFHQFLNFCEAQFESRVIDINYKSVEMLADDLYAQIGINYPGRDVTIDISEDGECGCSIVYETRNPKEVAF